MNLGASIAMFGAIVFGGASVCAAIMILVTLTYDWDFRSWPARLGSIAAVLLLLAVASILGGLFLFAESA